MYYCICVLIILCSFLFVLLCICVLVLLCICVFVYSLKCSCVLRNWASRQKSATPSAGLRFNRPTDPISRFLVVIIIGVRISNIIIISKTMLPNLTKSLKFTPPQKKKKKPTNEQTNLKHTKQQTTIIYVRWHCSPQCFLTWSRKISLTKMTFSSLSVWALPVPETKI